ncbi:DUF4344 domain-containing metallopeptidase [Streptomyces sp. BR1]|uniref:DUF4344 domain-containing metallopeptidase n=1 Tax=Streptomyces sp. BR1 TaxID=1592323 RepID=UPI00402BA6A0
MWKSNLRRLTRHIPCTALCATVLVTSCTTSGHETAGSQKGTAPVGSGFVARYERPSAADRSEAAFLRAEKTLEKGSTALNTFLALEHEVTLIGRSCHGEGSSYDPETRHVEICYDEVAEDRKLFQDAGYPRPDEAVNAVVAETVFHEAGHALIDVLDLPLGGRNEEDTADQFAAIMLIRQGSDGEHQLRLAAQEYELSAATSEAPDPKHSDEHSTDPQRAANHLCYLYGASPVRNADLAHTRNLPSQRVKGCGTEWTRVRNAWLKNLAPSLRER